MSPERWEALLRQLKLHAPCFGWRSTTRLANIVNCRPRYVREALLVLEGSGHVECYRKANGVMLWRQTMAVVNGELA